MKQNNALNTALTALRQRWASLAPREQNLVLIAGSILLLALTWSIALAPALKSLETAPTRRAAADRNLQTMLQLQSQAELLRQRPQAVNADINTQLEQSLKAEMPTTAQMQWLGNRVQITLTNAPAPALARWLSQVRDNSHASVVEMKLSRAPADTKDATLVHWSGNLLLDLPGQGDEAH